jgi:hypothetical protein
VDVAEVGECLWQLLYIAQQPGQLLTEPVQQQRVLRSRHRQELADVDAPG